MSITLKTTAFQNGQPIPKRFSGDGADVSPPLTWTDPPDDTKELALIVDDPDAPTAEPWVHWVIYRLPAETRSLPEGVPAQPRLSAPAAVLQGKNSWGTIGYRGPAPPRGHGTHHYHFRLYALGAPLAATPGLDKNALLKAMKGHVLAEAELVGTYQR
jgi:Raf kinase inhibitor-like YbhB/YbcL family protein